MASSLEAGNSPDGNIEMWKIKRLIKRLNSASGNGTSMISLMVPARGQLSRVTTLLREEYGTASNIKSPLNKLSVISAITSVQARLKLYTRVPQNGLVIYCGTISTDEGKTKKVNIDFEPFKPINKFMYMCDNKFHTQELAKLLENDSRFGFIVIDGNGALFGILCGNNRQVIHKFCVDLPKKHRRGGQSAPRFARLRTEKRHNYVGKVAEVASQLFLSGERVNISGLVLAGSADLKTDLSKATLFDPRLAATVLKVVDISYGGENGFNQAIDMSSDILGNIKFIQERKLIGLYFDEISRDTGKYCFGINDTLKCLELGAVQTLIVWENLDIIRYTLRNNQTEESHILHLRPDQIHDKRHFSDPKTGVEIEIEESELLLEWLVNEYTKFGAAIEIITDNSSEGTQFVKGFGGLGGILRYQVNLLNLGPDPQCENLEEEFDLDDY